MHVPKRSLVTWLITLLLIICPSSYKARPDNLIGLNSFCSGIVSPQRSNARPNFPTSNVVGGAKFVWHPGYYNSFNTTDFSFLPFPPQEAINLLEPMTNDPVNYVRQGALISSALIMIQQSEVTCPKVSATGFLD